MSLDLDLPSRVSARAAAAAAVSAASTAAGRHAAGMPRRRYAGDLGATLAALGAGAVVGSTWVMSSQTWSTPGGPLTVLGTLTAMLGTYLSLVLIVVVARVPWLERDIGQDRLIAFHRRLAPWVVGLISAHVVLTTMGYAQSMGISWWAQFTELVLGYPWLMPATVAFALMLVLSVASIRRARSKAHCETWWVGHLYLYLSVVLAFGHQLTAGSIFLGNEWARVGWIALYVAVAALVVGSRVLLPLVRNGRHRLRVAAVVPDSEGVVSIYLTGRNLATMPVRGGQFFEWRFGTRAWWWQAHPYSLSAAPDGRSLRITVKNLGDQSGALAELRPGTRVLAEGPYGAFTAERARPGAPIVALAAGVGIAPLVSLLGSLPPDRKQVTLIYRVVTMTPGTIALRAEVEELVASRGWTLRYLTGEIDECTIDAVRLSVLAPDLPRADVFACGPRGFLDKVAEATRVAGVPAERFHDELFVF